MVVVAVDVAVVMVMVAAVVNVVAVVVVPAIAVVADHWDGGGDGGCGLPPKSIRGFPTVPQDNLWANPPAPKSTLGSPTPQDVAWSSPPSPPTELN